MPTPLTADQQVMQGAWMNRQGFIEKIQRIAYNYNIQRDHSHGFNQAFFMAASGRVNMHGICHGVALAYCQAISRGRVDEFFAGAFEHMGGGGGDLGGTSPGAMAGRLQGEQNNHRRAYHMGRAGAAPHGDMLTIEPTGWSPAKSIGNALAQHLSGCSEGELFFLNSPNHSMVMGVDDRGAFFFDPNAGDFVFRTKRNCGDFIRELMSMTEFATGYRCNEGMTVEQYGRV